MTKKFFAWKHVAAALVVAGCVSVGTANAAVNTLPSDSSVNTLTADITDAGGTSTSVVNDDDFDTAGYNLTFMNPVRDFIRLGYITGTGNVIINVTGTLTFLGTSDYDGNTTITTGTLLVTGTLGDVGGVANYGGAIANAGTLHMNQAGAQTLSGIISGTGALEKSGAGTLTLSATNDYTGDTTITAGTLLVTGTLGDVGGIANYGGAIANAGTLHMNQAGAQTLSGIISGTGALEKSGVGILTLSGTNDYDGDTTINAGATLEVTGTLGDVGGVANYGGAIANAGTLHMNQAGAQELSGIISGTGVLEKSGAGILTLSGTNDYDGDTTINAGATLEVTGTLGDVGGVANYASFINNAGTLHMNQAGNQEISLRGITGAGSLVKGGAGTLTLTGVSTYTGNTTINAGVLEIGAGGKITISPTATLASGIYQDAAGAWTSNIITSGGTIVFDAGSTWFIPEPAGYHGGPITGDISGADSGAAAALAKGNLQNQLYDFSISSDGTHIRGTAAAKISDTIVNTPLLFVPNAMGTAAVGRVQQRFALLPNGNGMYRGQECAPCDRAGRMSPMGPISVWTNYIGRSTELVSSSTNPALGGKSKITSDGVQFGADRVIGKRTVFGAMFNYERALDVLNASRMTGNNYAFAVYGAHQFRSGFDALAMLGYGRQNYESRRVDLAGFLNTAKYNGNTLETTLEVGRRFRMNQSLWLRPAVAFDLYNNDVENFTETGTNALATPLAFGKMSLTQAFIRIGGDAMVKRGRFVGTSGFYYSHQMSQYGNQVRTSVRNGTVGVFGTDLGRDKLTFNLGGSYAVGPAASLFGGYSGDYFTDRVGTPWGHNGYVGVRYQF